MDQKNYSRKQFLTYSAIMGATLALSPLVGCSTSTNSNAREAANAISSITTNEVPVIKDTGFDGIYIGMSQDEFTDLGFQLGDSVDVVLSNRKSYEDVPFYNGYYARTGDPIIVSYPGSSYPKFTRAQMGIWDESGITEDGTITVTLREAGKYLTVQQALGVKYSNNRSDYASDVAFANFRACAGGKLRSNFVYRSASPVDNTYSRAAYACALVAQAGIQYGLDLSDNAETFATHAAESGDSCKYYVDLHEAGNVDTVKLTDNFSGDAFKTSISAALARMCEKPGPYLIHCVEGKDRTGFACMLVEALVGAKVDEVIDDYMTTYDNYYYTNEQSDPDRYEAIKNVMCYDSLMIIADVEDEDDVTEETLQAGAKRYLREGGLTDDQIAHIANVLA